MESPTQVLLLEVQLRLELELELVPELVSLEKYS